MNICTPYLRWRHSRGFGVHSPYAYSFIMDVLRPGPYRYYSDLEVENHLKGNEYHDHRFIHLIRFTIRLAIFLKSKRIITSSSFARLAEIAAASLGKPFLVIKNSKNVTLEPGDFLITGKSDIKISFLEEAIGKGIPVYALDPSNEIRHSLETPIERGLLFTDKKSLILIPREEMSYVAYEINL